MKNKIRIECRTIAEFDACIADGNIAIIFDLKVVARDKSSVVAWGNSSVVARGNSSVEARGNSSVVAWDNSSVVAWGNVIIRLWSALSIKASADVTIIKHRQAQSIEGGRQLDAAPDPVTGAEWCQHWGIDAKTSPYVVPDIDVAILNAITTGKAGFNMSFWHRDPQCNETNWCKTTHCRAGFAICLAGKAGFDLSKKYSPEMAGKMIYAVSRPDQPLPNFHASNEDALADLKRCAGVEK